MFGRVLKTWRAFDSRVSALRPRLAAGAGDHGKAIEHLLISGHSIGDSPEEQRVDADNDLEKKPFCGRF
jgi:hypothetical protein